MSEYKFELDTSDYLKTRSKLLKSNDVPKLGDVKKNLGDALAEVVFQQCEEPLRADLGLKEPLKGPGLELWVSPSDLLMGKLALKPPFTPKCLQALTHKGIMEIGQGIESKFKHEMEMEKERALEACRIEATRSVEERMKSEIKDVEIRERVRCRVEIEKLNQEFEAKLIEELDKLQKKLEKEHRQALKDNKTSLREHFLEDLKKEVEATVERMTRQFVEKLDEQGTVLMKHFQLELKKREMLREADTLSAKERTKEALKQLKHNMECTNLVNMMYVLCTERRKCCDQKTNIEGHYRKLIADLEVTLAQKEERIVKLLKIKDQKIKEVKVRETLLIEILKQFQKFINFALRAAPTQAEFLLSVEKMLVFELTEAVKCATKLKPHKNIMPWRYSSKSIPSKASSIDIKDHHNCLNEMNPPVDSDASEMGPEDVLPAMYFKNKTYIREDFKNMLSAGLEIRPSGELWNKDVEILIENWRKMSRIVEEEQSTSSEEGPTPDSNVERRTNQSMVQFVSGKAAQSESRVPFAKTSLKISSLSNEESSEAFHPKASVSKLLAVRDSVELLKDKILSATRLETAEDEIVFSSEARSSNNLALEVKDSIILRKVSLVKKPSSIDCHISPKDSIEVAKSKEDSCELKPGSSRLISARNSVEMLKESMAKLREETPVCHKKQPSNSQANGFLDTCCDRCKRKSSSRRSSLAKSLIGGDERSVKLSHIEVISLDRPSTVSFSRVICRPETSTPRVAKRTKPRAVRRQPKAPPQSSGSGVKVVGRKGGAEGQQSNAEFTANRIHSLIKLMKDEPCLMRLFTAGGR